MTERERLAELIESAMYWGYTTPSEIAERLIDEGMIVPPCKVGDTVYYIGGIHGRLVKRAIVKDIIVSASGTRDLMVTSELGETFENSFDIFYLTRKEAEAALAERRTQ